MLYIRKYTIEELSEVFSCNANKQALCRRLKRYEIDFTTEGRGKECIFNIIQIPDKFKMFCITELGFNAQSDFIKVRNFYNHFLNDDEFLSMPDEIKESRMRSYDQGISRQTISGYIKKLADKELVYTDGGEYIYYFAFKGNQIFTDEKTYKKAWSTYWMDKGKGISTSEAISNMIANYGGVARKQSIALINGCYLDKINELTDYIAESIEKEIESNI